jgi:hypothetical protein
VAVTDAPDISLARADKAIEWAEVRLSPLLAQSAHS